jgi:hypothetical protein
LQMNLKRHYAAFFFIASTNFIACSTIGEVDETQKKTL